MSSRHAQASLTLVGGTNRRELSDAELARGLISGDGWALNATWHRFAPMVLTLTERCLGSRAEAEDITQEIFLGVFRKAGALREPEKLRSFVYSFAVRALKSELRRRKVRAWLSFHAPEALVDIGSEALDMESRDLLRRFYLLLDRLGARDRLIFSLREVQSMTVDEIAEAMNVSLSTVKRSLRHTESRLSGWIQGDPELASALDTPRWKR